MFCSCFFLFQLFHLSTNFLRRPSTDILETFHMSWLQPQRNRCYADFLKVPLTKKTVFGEAVQTFGTEFWKFNRKVSFFQKTQKFLTKFQRLATSGRHNSAMITDGRKLNSEWSLNGMSSFHFYRLNQFKSILLGCTRCPSYEAEATSCGKVSKMSVDGRRKKVCWHMKKKETYMRKT